MLHPKRTEAEYFDSTGRLATVTSPGDAGVGPGDRRRHRRWRPEHRLRRARRLDRLGPDEPDRHRRDLAARGLGQAGARPGEVRTGSADGPTVATITVPRTGGWQSYGDYSAEPSGDSTTVSGPLYFVQTAGGSNVNWIDFIGRGVTDNRAPRGHASADPVDGHRPARGRLHRRRPPTPTATSRSTYDWVFGDGGDRGQPRTSTHTYTEPGTYRRQGDARPTPGAPQAAETRRDPGRRRSLTPASPGVRTTSSATRSTPTGGTPCVRRQPGPAGRRRLAGRSRSTATDIYGANGTDHARTSSCSTCPPVRSTATAKVTLAARARTSRPVSSSTATTTTTSRWCSRAARASPTAAANVFQFAEEVERFAPRDQHPGLGEDFPDTVWVRLTSRRARPDGLLQRRRCDFTEMRGPSPQWHHEPRIGLFGLANRDGGRCRSPRTSTPSRSPRTTRPSRATARRTPRRPRSAPPSSGSTPAR